MKELLRVRTYLLALLDRAARTAIQVAAGYVVAARTVGPVDWHTILLAVGLAVVVSLLQSAVDFPAIPGGWLGDVTGRALRTFAQTAVASVGASVLWTQVPWPTVLTAAALAALSSVVTSGVATTFGPATTVGTPDLVSLPDRVYAGYADQSRHLAVVSRCHATSGLAAGAAGCAFLLVTAVGVVGVTHAVRPAPVVVAVAPTVTAPPLPPVTPPTSPERAPAFLEALQRNGIPTANDSQALLLLASSVCTYRLTTSDAALTDKIVGVFPGRWTHAQAALIVDAAVDSYCI